MLTRLLRTLFFAIAVAGLLAAPALAQGRGHGRFDRDSRVRVSVSPHDRGVLARTRPGVIFGTGFGPSGRPPGWDRGRKVGWGGCDLPPGLAKKYGCYRSRIVLGSRPWFARTRPQGVSFVLDLR